MTSARHPYRLLGVGLLLALLALWQVSALSWVDSPNWPPVTEILRALVDGLRSGELVQVFGSTLWRMLAGFAIGTSLGVALGLAMATLPRLEAALRPLVELLRPIPIPAIVPPLILLLGIDHTMKVFVVAFASFFPVLVNTVGGVHAVEGTTLDVARTLQVGRARTLLKVVLPALTVARRAVTWVALTCTWSLPTTPPSAYWIAASPTTVPVSTSTVLPS